MCDLLTRNTSFQDIHSEFRHQMISIQQTNLKLANYESAIECIYI